MGLLALCALVLGTFIMLRKPPAKKHRLRKPTPMGKRTDDHEKNFYEPGGKLHRHVKPAERSVNERAAETRKERWQQET